MAMFAEQNREQREQWDLVEEGTPRFAAGATAYVCGSATTSKPNASGSSRSMRACTD